MSDNYRQNIYNVNNIENCIKHIYELDKNIKYSLMDVKKNKYMKKDLVVKNCKIHFLGKGGQGIVYLLESKGCGHVVFKITKVNNETKNEVFFLTEATKLINNKITPNFIYNYANKIIYNYYYIFNEYADGTLEQWAENNHTIEEWKSFMFQILDSIFILQNKLKTYHADLKPKNILYKKIKNGYFKYIINDNTYFVPTFGYLFMISDFGKSQSLLLSNNIISDESIKGFINSNSDLEHIQSLPKRIIVSALEQKYNNNMENLINLINNYNDERFVYYFNSEKEKINLGLSKYPTYIKNLMLLRSIIYYAIEKKYININDIPKNLFKMKYPPHEVNVLLEYIFSLKIPINEILEQNFFEYKIKQEINILETFIYN